MATKPNLGTDKIGAGLGELKARLLFLVLALLVYRIGTHMPVPGIDPNQLTALFQQNEGTFLGLFNMFSGGALERMSIVALGIMPYISSSIIMQLLTAVSPQLEQLKKEGESGRRKITQYTRYGALALATVQGTGMTVGLLAPMAYEPGIAFNLVAIISLVTGAMFMMWLGEQITERGVGNGISMLIFAGIVAGLPAAIGNSLVQANEGQISGLLLFVVAIIAVVVIAAIVFIERGQRRITINYAKRQQGRKMYAAQSSHLPLKVNMAGVIPAIFASSILLFPASLGQWFGQSGSGMEWLADIALLIGPGQPLYIIIFSAMILFFCFFYTALVFNPKDVAENLKRQGAYIPGIRPGEQTAKYIDSVLTRLTMFGAVYITVVCLLPNFFQMMANVPFNLGGTALLIVVVVSMDFMSQVQSHLMSHQYDSLMKKSNLGSFGR
ncbi:MAG: preprotein translocase subunit SecY [Pseudohongiellaceae bacterium]|nr:preprotein translocase subunit SecY [Pseudohongiellaceae bacterium]